MTHTEKIFQAFQAEARNYPQVQVARELGIDPAQLHRLLKHEGCNIRTLIKIERWMEQKNPRAE